MDAILVPDVMAGITLAALAILEGHGFHQDRRRAVIKAFKRL
jgi:hypothetical protein